MSQRLKMGNRPLRIWERRKKKCSKSIAKAKETKKHSRAGDCGDFPFDSTMPVF